MVAFVGLRSSVVFMRHIHPKERPRQGPFLISSYNPDRLPIHLRTNSRHSAKPHPAQAGQRHRIVGYSSPGYWEAPDKASPLLDPPSVLFPIKHIQPAASDQIQAIAAKDVQARSQFASISMPQRIVRAVQQLLAVSRLPEIQSFLSPGAVKCLCNAMAYKNGCLQC